MFTDILKKELKVNFYKDINCDAFEIPNFFICRTIQGLT